MCRRAMHEKWLAKHPGRAAALTRKWRMDNPEKAKEMVGKWQAANPGRVREYARKWIKEHPENMTAYHKRKSIKRSNTPKEKLSSNMSCLISYSLKHNGSKAGRHWESLVDYTVDQLKKNLERQFKPGMSWDNRDKWHIDHKIPVRAFNFEKPEDIDFKKCWALKNLQPMWAAENLSKNDGLSKPFQPSLTI